MKIAKYALNSDGTVPDFVIDGGYFAFANNYPSPQDFDLVGVVSDDAPVTAFASINDFVNYLKSIGADSWVDSDAPFDYQAQALTLWIQLDN
jgi:hypothetical protein